MVEDTLFLNLPVRLAKKLLTFADSDGEKTPEGVRIQLRLSQEEWGDLVGATRESINKQMRAWADEGLISLEHGYVTIRCRERMEALASCVIG
jgi:CRP-like cAMP-binding protein